jgi:hypothetical protein
VPDPELAPELESAGLSRAGFEQERESGLELELNLGLELELNLGLEMEPD